MIHYTQNSGSSLKSDPLGRIDPGIIPLDDPLMVARQSRADRGIIFPDCTGDVKPKRRLYKDP